MQKYSEIDNAASILSNLLEIGEPLYQALQNLHSAQPAAGWTDVAERVRAGARLSECMTQLWPEALISAIAAGERAGNLPAVFRQIHELMQLQLQMQKSMRQMYKPLSYILLGAIAFIYFMIDIIPETSKNLTSMFSRKTEPSLIMKLSAVMQEVFYHYWIVILIGAAVFIGWLYQKSTEPAFREGLFELADRIPKLNEALRALYFGLWARSLATLASSGGIPISDMLMLSARTLPTVMQSGVILMASEVVTKGLAAAGDPQQQSDDDPRKRWPYYVGIAFKVADRTGMIDAEMQRVARILIEYGSARLLLYIQLADNAILIFSAITLFLPFAAHYYELGILAQQAMRE